MKPHPKRPQALKTQTQAHRVRLMVDFRQQRGSALIISLLILLVMTTLGVSAMMGSTLQERMVGNHKRSLETAWAAESGAIQAMRWLSQHEDTWKHAKDWKTQGVIPFQPRQLRGSNGPLVYWIERLEVLGETATVVSRGGALNAAGQVVDQNTVTVVWQSPAAEIEPAMRSMAGSRTEENVSDQPLINTASAPAPDHQRFSQVILWRLSVGPPSPSESQNKDKQKAEPSR